MKITAIQSDLFWENKEANLEMFQRKIGDCKGSNIIVLPEMFSTGFSMNPAPLAETMQGPTVQWMKEVSARNRMIITGSIIIEENGKYYNRLIWMLPDGSTGYYNKRHLFAFAGEHNYYSSGNRRLIASVNSWKINLIVCYDLRFPVWIRQKPSVENHEAEYDILIVVANWPQKRAHAWKSLLIARAIENQCYVVGVNRIGNDGKGIYHSGDSMIVDPLGEVLAIATNIEEALSFVPDKEFLEKTREGLPFLRDGDKFSFL